MSDFKVGDRVRVLEDGACLADVLEGEEGVVEAAHYGGLYATMDDGRQWWFDNDCIKKVNGRSETSAPRDHFLSRLEALYADNVAISKAKNSDYAQGDDPFQNFRMCEHYGVPVSKGIVVRMSDKLTRISNLLDKEPDVAGESILDACSDLANYSMILRVWLEQAEQSASWSKE